MSSTAESSSERPDRLPFFQPQSQPLSPKETWASSDEALGYLTALVARGGPTPEEHATLNACFMRLSRDRVPFEHVRSVVKPIISTPDSIQGFGFLKPHGYAGDFEMIERIYTSWHSNNPQLARYDAYFHSQPAPRAVRNRKAYFHDLLKSRSDANGASLRVLNLGSGPARDVFEILPAVPQASFDCIDIDEKAIEHGKSLCAEHLDRVRFRRQNVLRLRLDCAYDLIWSAGLFDYFSNRVFVTLLKRLVQNVTAGGEVVIGNFSEDNPSKYWMEAVGDWHLHHRSVADLTSLALQAGIDPANIRVGQEPEGINLFLHLQS